MGVTVVVTLNGLQEATARIQGFADKSVDLTPAMKQASTIMMRSIQQNFDSSGRPTAWTPLKESTLKQKRRLGYSSKPLIRTGALRQSIAPQIGRMNLILSTAVPYAKIHQYGGPAGRKVATGRMFAAQPAAYGRQSVHTGKVGKEFKHSAYIPARPYLIFQQQDLDRINDVVVEYLTGLDTNG